MKTVLVRNTFLFWLLLLAMAFGQERRDPTLPSQAIQQRMATATPASSETPSSPMKVKAIVLSDHDHGTALLETASGTVKLRLRREPAYEIMLDQLRYTLKDFNSSSITLERGGAITLHIK